MSRCHLGEAFDVARWCDGERCEEDAPADVVASLEGSTDCSTLGASLLAALEACQDHHYRISCEMHRHVENVLGKSRPRPPAEALGERARAFGRNRVVVTPASQRRFPPRDCCSRAHQRLQAHEVLAQHVPHRPPHTPPGRRTAWQVRPQLFLNDKASAFSTTTTQAGDDVDGCFAGLPPDGKLAVPPIPPRPPPPPRLPPPPEPPPEPPQERQEPICEPQPLRRSQAVPCDVPDALEKDRRVPMMPHDSVGLTPGHYLTRKQFYPRKPAQSSRHCMWQYDAAPVTVAELHAAARWMPRSETCWDQQNNPRASASRNTFGRGRWRRRYSSPKPRDPESKVLHTSITTSTQTADLSRNSVGEDVQMFSPSEFDRKRLRLVVQREQEAGETLQSYSAAHAAGTGGISIEIAPSGGAEAPVNQGVDCYHVKIVADSKFGGAGPVPNEPISTILARDSMLENRSSFASAVFAEPEDGPLRLGEKADSGHNKEHKEPMADITLATPRVPKLTVPNLREALQSQAEKTANQEETRHLDSKGPEPFEEPCHSQSQSNEAAQEVRLSGISMGSRQLNPAREVDEIQKGDGNEEIEPHFGCKEVADRKAQGEDLEDIISEVLDMFDMARSEEQ